MTIVKRVRDWWLGRLRAADGVGKAIWIGIPFLFACCGLTMCSALILPPEATPTAEVAVRELRPVISNGLHPVTAARSKLQGHPASPVPGATTGPAWIRRQQ